MFQKAYISHFLKEVSKIKNGFQRLSKISDYVKRLEDEMKKIDAFKRELPLCMFLLKDVIKRLKDEEMQCEEMDSELTLSLKINTEENGSFNMDNDGGDKKNWMNSVKLCNSKPIKIPELKLRNEEEDQTENSIEPSDDKSRGGAFVPFERLVDKEISGLFLKTPSSELASCNPLLKGGGSCRIGSCSSLYTDQNQLKFHRKSRHQQQQQQQDFRKQRRCWSPELHRRFVEVLQQLGGSKVATPTHIRELMQVDGLTNDEVKSHLQKYRLHIRKLPASAGQGNGPGLAQYQCSEHMKANISQFGSPQAPLHASASAKGMSSTGCNGMDAEEDEKSDGWSPLAGRD